MGKELLSPDSRYFWARGLSPDFVENHKIILSLIDVDKLQSIPAEGDVAFTSDGKFMVTMREGIPTLIDTDNGQILLYYQLPVPMTAASFSPNYQKLYLAGSDNKIYVFDSGLPNSSVLHWDCME